MATILFKPYRRVRGLRHPWWTPFCLELTECVAGGPLGCRHFILTLQTRVWLEAPWIADIFFRPYRQGCGLRRPGWAPFCLDLTNESVAGGTLAGSHFVELESARSFVELEEAEDRAAHISGI